MTKLRWTPLPEPTPTLWKTIDTEEIKIVDAAGFTIGKIVISKVLYRGKEEGWLGVLEYGKEREVFPHGGLCYPDKTDYFQSSEEATTFFEKHYDNIVTVCAVHHQNKNFLTHLRSLIKSSREVPAESTSVSRVN